MLYLTTYMTKHSIEIPPHRYQRAAGRQPWWGCEGYLTHRFHKILNMSTFSTQRPTPPKGIKNNFAGIPPWMLRPWNTAPFKIFSIHPLVKAYYFHMAGFVCFHVWFAVGEKKEKKKWTHRNSSFNAPFPPGDELSPQQLHRLPRKPEVIELRGGQSICFENHGLRLGQLPFVLRERRLARTLCKWVQFIWFAWRSVKSPLWQTFRNCCV